MSLQAQRERNLGKFLDWLYIYSFLCIYLLEQANNGHVRVIVPYPSHLLLHDNARIGIRKAGNTFPNQQPETRSQKPPPFEYTLKRTVSPNMGSSIKWFDTIPLKEVKTKTNSR